MEVITIIKLKDLVDVTHTEQKDEKRYLPTKSTLNRIKRIEV